MIQGKLHVFGHDLNTDLIHPPNYFSLDKERVREGFMKGLDPDFHERYSPATSWSVATTSLAAPAVRPASSRCCTTGSAP